MGLLRITRFPNLLIVALTQYLLYARLLLPQFKINGISPLLTPPFFALLVLVTIMITAGGYIINDIVDLPIDTINKPKRVVIDKVFSLRTVYWFYFCLTISGFFIAIFLAFHVGHSTLLSIYPLAVAGLYYYSTHFKCMPLLGNLLVSLYCTGVAWIVYFAELTGLQQLLQVDPEDGNYVLHLFYWYMAFAFLSTLFREIVKDLEDQQGDQISSCRTTPIAWGIKTSKLLATISGLLLLGFIFAMTQAMPLLFSGLWPWLFVIFVIALPTIYALWGLWQAKHQGQYHRISQLAKWIMFGGILFLIIICW